MLSCYRVIVLLCVSVLSECIRFLVYVQDLSVLSLSLSPLSPVSCLSPSVPLRSLRIALVV